MLAALIPVLGPLLDKVFGNLFPDPQAKAKALQDFYAQLAAADLAQMEVNKAEAANPSVFVAGWRPAIGWVCASALAYQYLFVPIAMWIGFVIGHPMPKPPTLDDSLWELMFGLLGLGGLRTIEKIKGVSK